MQQSRSVCSQRDLEAAQGARQFLLQRTAAKCSLHFVVGPEARAAPMEALKRVPPSQADFGALEMCTRGRVKMIRLGAAMRPIQLVYATEILLFPVP